MDFGAKALLFYKTVPSQGGPGNDADPGFGVNGGDNIAGFLGFSANTYQNENGTYTISQASGTDFQIDAVGVESNVSATLIVDMTAAIDSRVSVIY